MSEELRKAAQAVLDSIDAGHAAVVDRLTDALRSALAASQPASCPGCEGKPAPENNPCAVCGKAAPEPAPDLPPLPHAVRLWAGTKDVWDKKEMRAYGQQCYASAFYDRADMLKTICEQQEEIRALREREEAHAEAKRAPMTRTEATKIVQQWQGDADVVLSVKSYNALIRLFLEAASGLTEEQCRALVPPRDDIDEVGSIDWQIGYNHCRDETLDAITAAFHPKGEGK